MCGTSEDINEPAHSAARYPAIDIYQTKQILKTVKFIIAKAELYNTFFAISLISVRNPLFMPVFG